MKRREWPLWFKSGLIGACFAIVLYFIYGAILGQLEVLTQPLHLLMVVTGHALFIYVGFSYPGLQVCGHGNPACANLVEIVAMLAVCVVVLIYNFGIGALIGLIVQKILEKRQKS